MILKLSCCLTTPVCLIVNQTKDPFNKILNEDSFYFSFKYEKYLIHNLYLAFYVKMFFMFPIKPSLALVKIWEGWYIFIYLFNFISYTDKWYNITTITLWIKKMSYRLDLSDLKKLNHFGDFMIFKFIQ